MSKYQYVLSLSKCHFIYFLCESLPLISFYFVLEFRLVAQLNEIYKFVITGYLLWSVLTMCGMLVFLLNQIVEYFRRRNVSSSNSNWTLTNFLIFKDEWSLNILISIMLVASSYTFLYIFCNFGQKLTDQFELFEASVSGICFQSKCNKLLPLSWWMYNSRQQ